jgi:hypothetical protein
VIILNGTAKNPPTHEDMAMKLRAVLSMVSVAISATSSVYAFSGAVPSYRQVQLRHLECQVSNHPEIRSLSFFPKIDELAFFNHQGKEVPGFWDTFSAFYQQQDGSLIIGNFAHDQPQSAAEADLVVHQDGRGSVRIAPAAGAQLHLCRFGF